MSAQLCKTANGRFLLFTMSLSVILALVKENGAVIVKRDTTLDNVKAMYNRFISPSTGKAKYVKGGKNACSLDVPPSVERSPGILHVAASKDDFQSSLGCGVCLEVTGSGKPAAADLDGAPPVKGTLNAIVVDQDDTLNQGDLALLPPQSGSGLWQINFKAVDCPTGQGLTGFIQFRFTGSNEMYFKLQAVNAKVPVAGIEAFERVKSKWFCLTKTADNFFSSEGMGAVSFPLQVRLTSIMNEQLEATIEALKNDVVIKSDIQFSDTNVRGGSPEGIKCYGQGDRPSSDEGDASFCVSKEDGIYADQQDETAFYMCEGEKATKKFCPTGLKFNPMISSCDVPDDVKFVGNEADSAGKLQSKIITRWTSLPDNNGLKVLSVGGPEENEKPEDNVDLNTKKPHKIFSINIFNGAHSKPKSATDNGGMQPDKEQSNLKNSTATETTLPQADAKELQPSVSKGNFQDQINRTGGDNVSGSTNVTENTDLAISEHSKFSYDDQLQSSLHRQSASNPNSQAYQGTEILSNSKQLYIPSHLNVSSRLPESSFNSHTNLQNVQKAGKTNSSTGHLGFSPYKVFAINLFGLQSKEPTINNTNENIRLSGQQTGTAERYKDVPNDVSMQPLFDQMNDGEVINNPGTKSEYGYQQQSQLGDFGSKTVENSLPTTNDITSSPLHFKLKVEMDKTGKHPGINCTLSECSDPQSSLVTGSTVGSNYNHDSQKKKDDNEFHITLNTVGPDTLRGTLNPNLNRVPSLQRVPSQIQVVKYPYHLQDTSQSYLKPLNQTLGQSTQHINDNTSKGRKADLEVQNNGGITTNERLDKQEEHGNDTEMIPLQSASTNNKSAQDAGLTVSRHPFDSKYKGHVKNPDVQAAEYNDSKLENTRRISMKENFTEQTETNNNFKDQVKSRLQSTLHQDTLTSVELPENGIKSQLHEDAQLEKQNILQAHHQSLGSQPQLKIILKHPGKLGLFINPRAQLKKRSGARGHIVQILKSLIDKPFKLGAQSRAVVSNLIKKSNEAKTSQSDTDLQSIKDSGSIAQSILEANKEYLDDVAMQGMIFSDGDPETENMTDIADSIKLGNKYLKQTSESESPHWEIPNRDEEDELQDPSPDQGTKQDWQNDENVMNQDQDDEGYSSSASGMGDNNNNNKNKNNSNNNNINTVPANSTKTGKLGLDGSGGFVDNKNALSVSVGQSDDASKGNAYKGGTFKSKSDPRLKSFCIGKTSGIYTNPFEQKSFVICFNGISEERECPNTMLFNPKEKICDVPDQTYTQQSDKKISSNVITYTSWKRGVGKTKSKNGK